MPDRRILRIALLLLMPALLLAGADAAAQGPGAAGGDAADKGIFRPARGAGANAELLPEAFEFELSGYTYHVRSNGAGRRTKDGRTRLFNLRLEGRDFIERLYFAEYESNVILVCQVSDGKAAEGFVVRLEQPSMRARWRRVIPAFNVGTPARDGASLYLTAARFVARLDLKTGEYIWEHEGLGQSAGLEKSAGEARAEAATEAAPPSEAERPEGRSAETPFAAFDVPEVSGKEVLFRESGVYNRAPKVVRVNRRTGRILRIE
jgi:hypothetical protein